MFYGRNVDFLLLKEYFMEILRNFSNMVDVSNSRFTRKCSGIKNFPRRLQKWERSGRKVNLDVVRVVLSENLL